MTGLSLSNVAVALGDRPVVRNVSATFAPGECIALVGPNGAGKTTLLRALAGVLPYTGDLHCAGQSLAAMPPSARAKAIAYLPQGHQIHWPLPVREIVALGRYAHGATDPRRLPEKDAEAVARAMANADVSELADRPADALSGGERARVALARMLATEAQVLLADEPTASLDPRHQLGVMATLRQAAYDGALVIAVTHDLDLASQFSTRIVVMEQGRVTADGPATAALSAATLRKVFGIARQGDHWQATP